MNSPSGPDPSPPPSRGSGRGRAGLGSRRVVVTAFAVSALLHLAVILLYPTLFDRDFSDPTPFLLPLTGERARGMEVIQLVEVESDDPEAPPEPDEPEETEAPVEELEGPGLPDAVEEGGLVEPGPTAAERLRPRLGDARLWAPVDPALTELTLEQRLDLEMAGMLEAWRDSVAAAAEAERALTDWTFTDGSGGRWGVSEGQIHLGDLTLPLPFGFGVQPGRREEAAYRAWEWEQLQRQQVEGAVGDSWKERARAIRERRDRERAESRPDSAGIRRDR
jgi:hypothetical protein